MENNQTGYVPNLSARIQTLSETTTEPTTDTATALPVGLGIFSTHYLFTFNAGVECVDGFTCQRIGPRWFGIELQPQPFNDDHGTYDFDGLKFPGEVGYFYERWELLDGFFNEGDNMVITDYISGKICLIRLDRYLNVVSDYYGVSLNMVYKHTHATSMAALYEPIEI